MADRQAVFVGFASGVSVQREFPNFSRSASLHFLFHSGMRDNQPAVVQHVMADQAEQEFGDFRAKPIFYGIGKRVDFRKCFIQPVGDGDILSPEFS